MKYFLHGAFILVLFVYTACKQETFDERCLRETKAYTERFCPQRVGKDIVLDSITYSITTRTRSYYHTLSGEYDNAELMKQSANTFKQEALNSIRNSVEMKAMKDKKVNFVYIFHSKSSHKELLRTTFTYDDYTD